MKYYLDRAAVEGDVEAAETIATNLSSAIGIKKIRQIEISFEYSKSKLGVRRVRWIHLLQA
jgi:hypothetical protein